MNDPGRELGLPYEALTARQAQGRKTEKRLAKEKQARLHPMSGAGSIKDDASNEETIYEFKDAMKSHSLNGRALLDLWRRGVRSGKNAEYVVYFTADDFTATITVEKGRRT